MATSVNAFSGDDVNTYGSFYSTAPGVKQGVKVGKKILKERDDISRHNDVPFIRTGDGGFPVPVAPWDETEANLREKVEAYSNFVGSAPFAQDKVKGKELISIPFNLDHNELIKIHERKRSAAERLNWYTFLTNLMKKYHYSPDIVKYVKSQAPEYYAERQAQIDRNLEIQRMVANLALKVVPDTPEELRFLYLLSTGAIKIPTRPAHLPEVEDRSEALQRGLFSVRRRDWGANSGNPEIFDIFGDKTNPFAFLQTEGDNKVTPGVVGGMPGMGSLWNQVNASSFTGFRSDGGKDKERGSEMTP